MTGCKGLLIALLLAPALALPAACARVVNPATGQTEFTAMSPDQELRLGKEQHPQVLMQFGGAYADPQLQAYVTRIGEQLAAVSELPELEFTFTVLNSEVINAFALPGGYVYITRGLLALADNEAELAGVMAHEIGHVTARHSAQRYSRGVMAQGGLAVGTILAAVLGGGAAADLVQQAGGLGTKAYLAGYSRDQEFQADELGVRYLARVGYDPTAMSSFLDKLERNDQLMQRLAGRDGADPAASWFATHPRTPDRVLRTAERASAETAGDHRISRDEYLTRIDGLIYGEDPSHGFVRGRTFVHPELRFAFEMPDGYRIVNTPAAVIGQAQNGLMKFDTAEVPRERDVGAYLARDWARELGAGSLGNVAQSQVNGMPAASAVAAGQLDNGRPVTVALAALRAGNDRVYRFMFVSPGRMSSAQANAYQATVNSFRQLSADEAAAIRARRLQVVTVEPGQDADDYARRMAVDALPREQFELLNDLDSGSPLSPGQKVKLVVGRSSPTLVSSVGHAGGLPDLMARQRTAAGRPRGQKKRWR
jgi:predicted Zn-dependent protease